MPKLRFARQPLEVWEGRQVRKLAGSRHAPGDWIRRARMIVRSWEGQRTTAIARALGCHPQTVRERVSRFNAAGIDGLGDRPGAGRKPRLTEQERGMIIGLARSTAPGKPTRVGDDLQAHEPDQDAQWSLDALTRAAHEQGIQVERSQLRRILLHEGVRWRHQHRWAASTDPDFGPKGPGSSLSTLTHRRAQRSSVLTNSVP